MTAHDLAKKTTVRYIRWLLFISIIVVGVVGITSMLRPDAVVFNTLVDEVSAARLNEGLELQEQATTLLTSLCDFICSPSCDDLKVDALLSTTSTTFSGLSSCAQSSNQYFVAEKQYQPSACEISICCTIAQALKRRQALRELNQEDDGMDVDGEFDSQGSSQSQAATTTLDLPNVLYAYFSRFAMRYGTELYANAIVAVHGEGRGGGGHLQASGRIMDFLLKQSEVAMHSNTLCPFWNKPWSNDGRPAHSFFLHSLRIPRCQAQL